MIKIVIYITSEYWKEKQFLNEYIANIFTSKHKPAYEAITTFLSVRIQNKRTQNNCLWMHIKFKFYFCDECFKFGLWSLEKKNFQTFEHSNHKINK